VGLFVGVFAILYHRKKKRIVNLRPVEQKTVMHLPSEAHIQVDLLSQMLQQYAQDAEVRSSNPMKFAPLPVPALPKSVNTMDTQSVRNLVKVFQPNAFVEERRRSSSFNLPPPPPFDPPPPTEEERVAYPPMSHRINM